jgi:hypothetical protein
MSRVVRAVGLASALLATLGAACTAAPTVDVPVRPAPASRHASLVDALADDARLYLFNDGNWAEDFGDAPFYGLAWLSRRAAATRAASLLGDVTFHDGLAPSIMAALGLAEYVAVTRNPSATASLEDFVERLDTLVEPSSYYFEENAGAVRPLLHSRGPTELMALVALLYANHALYVGGPRRQERVNRAVALDARIRERALSDLSDARSGRVVRAYAAAKGSPGLFEMPNLAMLFLKARLFRLTRDEVFRLEARSLYGGALQSFARADGSGRMTLASRNSFALGLLLLFEITGDLRFVDEADRVVDEIAALRGPWCRSAAIATKCVTVLVDPFLDGDLDPEAHTTGFCAGCNLQSLYVVGYRRTLARERY